MLKPPSVGISQNFLFLVQMKRAKTAITPRLLSELTTEQHRQLVRSCACVRLGTQALMEEKIPREMSRCRVNDQKKYKRIIPFKEANKIILSKETEMASKDLPRENPSDERSSQNERKRQADPLVVPVKRKRGRPCAVKSFKKPPDSVPTEIPDPRTVPDSVEKLKEPNSAKVGGKSATSKSHSTSKEVPDKSVPAKASLGSISSVACKKKASPIEAGSAKRIRKTTILNANDQKQSSSFSSAKIPNVAAQLSPAVVFTTSGAPGDINGTTEKSSSAQDENEDTLLQTQSMSAVELLRNFRKVHTNKKPAHTSAENRTKVDSEKRTPRVTSENATNSASGKSTSKVSSQKKQVASSDNKTKAASGKITSQVSSKNTTNSATGKMTSKACSENTPMPASVKRTNSASGRLASKVSPEEAPMAASVKRTNSASGRLASKVSPEVTPMPASVKRTNSASGRLASKVSPEQTPMASSNKRSNTSSPSRICSEHATKVASENKSEPAPFKSTPNSAPGKIMSKVSSKKSAMDSSARMKKASSENVTSLISSTNTLVVASEKVLKGVPETIAPKVSSEILMNLSETSTLKVSSKKTTSKIFSETTRKNSSERITPKDSVKMRSKDSLPSEQKAKGSSDKTISIGSFAKATKAASEEKTSEESTNSAPKKLPSAVSREQTTTNTSKKIQPRESSGKRVKGSSKKMCSCEKATKASSDKEASQVRSKNTTNSASAKITSKVCSANATNLAPEQILSKLSTQEPTKTLPAKSSKPLTKKTPTVIHTVPKKAPSRAELSDESPAAVSLDKNRTRPSDSDFNHEHREKKRRKSASDAIPSRARPAETATELPVAVAVIPVAVRTAPTDLCVEERMYRLHNETGAPQITPRCVAKEPELSIIVDELTHAFINSSERKSAISCVINSPSEISPSKYVDIDQLVEREDGAVYVVGCTGLSDPESADDRLFLAPESAEGIRLIDSKTNESPGDAPKCVDASDIVDSGHVFLEEKVHTTFVENVQIIFLESSTRKVINCRELCTFGIFPGDSRNAAENGSGLQGIANGQSIAEGTTYGRVFLDVQNWEEISDTVAEEVVIANGTETVLAFDEADRFLTCETTEVVVMSDDMGLEAPWDATESVVATGNATAGTIDKNTHKVRCLEPREKSDFLIVSNTVASKDFGVVIDIQSAPETLEELGIAETEAAIQSGVVVKKKNLSNSRKSHDADLEVVYSKFDDGKVEEVWCSKSLEKSGVLIDLTVDEKANKILAREKHISVIVSNPCCSNCAPSPSDLLRNAADLEPATFYEFTEYPTDSSQSAATMSKEPLPKLEGNNLNPKIETVVDLKLTEKKVTYVSQIVCTKSENPAPKLEETRFEPKLEASVGSKVQKKEPKEDPPRAASALIPACAIPSTTSLSSEDAELISIFANSKSINRPVRPSTAPPLSPLKFSSPIISRVVVIPKSETDLETASEAGDSATMPLQDNCTSEDVSSPAPGTEEQQEDLLALPSTSADLLQQVTTDGVRYSITNTLIFDTSVEREMQAIEHEIIDLCGGDDFFENIVIQSEEDRIITIKEEDQVENCTDSAHSGNATGVQSRVSSMSDAFVIAETPGPSGNIPLRLETQPIPTESNLNEGNPAGTIGNNALNLSREEPSETQTSVFTDIDTLVSIVIECTDRWFSAYTSGHVDDTHDQQVLQFKNYINYHKIKVAQLTQPLLKRFGPEWFHGQIFIRVKAKLSAPNRERQRLLVAYTVLYDSLNVMIVILATKPETAGALQVRFMVFLTKLHEKCMGMQYMYECLLARMKSDARKSIVIELEGLREARRRKKFDQKLEQLKREHNISTRTVSLQRPERLNSYDSPQPPRSLDNSPGLPIQPQQPMVQPPNQSPQIQQRQSPTFGVHGGLPVPLQPTVPPRANNQQLEPTSMEENFSIRTVLRVQPAVHQIVQNNNSPAPVSPQEISNRTTPPAPRPQQWKVYQLELYPSEICTGAAIPSQPPTDNVTLQPTVATIIPANHVLHQTTASGRHNFPCGPGSNLAMRPCPQPQRPLEPPQTVLITPVSQTSVYPPRVTPSEPGGPNAHVIGAPMVGNAARSAGHVAGQRVNWNSKENNHPPGPSQRSHPTTNNAQHIGNDCVRDQMCNLNTPLRVQESVVIPIPMDVAATAVQPQNSQNFTTQEKSAPTNAVAVTSKKDGRPRKVVSVGSKSPKGGAAKATAVASPNGDQTQQDIGIRAGTSTDGSTPVNITTGNAQKEKRRRVDMRTESLDSGVGMQSPALNNTAENQQPSPTSDVFCLANSDVLENLTEFGLSCEDGLQAVAVGTDPKCCVCGALAKVVCDVCRKTCYCGPVCQLSWVANCNCYSQYSAKV